VWKVIAQQVMMMRWDLGALAPLFGVPPPVNIFNVDAWEGYQVARDRVMAFLASNGIQNAVVLSGDIHSAWAANLHADPADVRSQIVGAEFVCSSVTSTFGDSNAAAVPATLASNPHIRFFNGLFRGYVRCTVTPGLWRADYRAITRIAHPIFTVPSPDAPVFNLASFTLSAGQSGLTQVV
jgi:alkaline phosphatase D